MMVKISRIRTNSANALSIAAVVLSVATATLSLLSLLGEVHGFTVVSRSRQCPSHVVKTLLTSRGSDVIPIHSHQNDDSTNSKDVTVKPQRQQQRRQQEQQQHHHQSRSYGEDRRQWIRRVASTVALSSSSSSLLLSSPSSALALAVITAPTAAASTSDYVVPTPPFTNEVSWPLGKVAFSLLPLAGTSTRRATVEECVVQDTMWTHDQIQGIVNVNVPVRQVVIRLSPESGGGLWVLNPVAPTPQLVQMMNRLERMYGPVRHVVLGTVALEHKATFGAFCQRYPDATVWIQPGQWSFPIDLPIDALGVTQKGQRLRELPIEGRQPSSSLFRTVSERYGPQPEWINDIQFEILGPFRFKSVGGFSETAFYHKQTQSLLVTDTVVSVTDTPPPIIEEDPRALLFHARDNITEVVQDTPVNRKRGWRRMVQFGLVFFPSQINVVPALEAVKEASRIDKSMSNLGDGAVPFNVYPWTWNGNDDERNFKEISQNGKLFCPPILTKLILDREVDQTLAWVDRVCTRFPNMKRVIACHLNNNVRATKDDFYHAFDPLRSTPSKVIPQRPLAEDLALLQKASDVLTELNVVGPSAVCDGEEARFVGRFASR